MTVRVNRRIQSLRGLAIIMVVAYHLEYSLFRFGYLGVDIFLVLSGFLIYNTLNSSRPVKIFEYFFKRFRRIVPALVFMLVMTIPLVFYVSTPADFISIREGLLYSIFFLANLLYFNSVDYFNPSIGANPFLHLWSISLEVQFYVVAPLVFWMARKFGGIKFLACLSFLSLGLWIVYQFRFESAAFYLLPMRFWEFSLGAIVAAWLSSDVYSLQVREFVIKCKPEVTRRIIAVIIFGLVLIPLSNSWVGNIVLVLLTSGYLTFSVQELPEKKDVWNPLVFLGNISYSLYLCHFPVIYFFNRVELDSRFGNFVSLFVIAAVLVLSLICYSFVERPFLSWKFVFQPSGYRSILAIFLGTFVFQGYFLSTNYARDLWLGLRVDSEQRHNYELVSSYAFQDISKNRIVDDCIRFSDSIDADVVSNLHRCTQGGRKAFILFGDSHAMNLHNVYARAFPNDTIFTFAGGGCRPAQSETCFYKEFPQFIEENASHIRRIVFHQSGSYLFETRGVDSIGSTKHAPRGRVFVLIKDVDSIMKYLQEIGGIVPTTWVGPFAEAQLDFRDPANWMNATVVSPVSAKEIISLDKILSSLVGIDRKFLYVSSVDNLRFQEDRVFQSDCLVWNDQDHWSSCGEQILSRESKQFLKFTFF